MRGSVNTAMPTHHVLIWVVCMRLSIGGISCASSCNNFVWHKPAPAPLVAFSMASSTPRVASTWTLIPLETTLYNDGGYFDTSANVFRAPVNGVYSFTFGGLSGQGKRLSLHLYRQKPGESKIHVARAFDSSTSMWGGASGACIVKLAAGEMMSLWMAGAADGQLMLYGSSGVYGSTTLFSGVYIGGASYARECSEIVWQKPATAPAPVPFVAFSMASSTSHTPTTRTLLPFAITFYNDGGYFDMSANVFRVPLNGVYSFMFGGLSGQGKHLALHLYRQKPGVTKIEVASAYDSSATLWGGASGGCIVRLDVGETVSLWMDGNLDRSHAILGAGGDWGPLTLFSGKLEQDLP